MRIAIANGGICLSKGGAERSAIRLVVEMMKRGHDTRILTYQTQYPPLYDIDLRIPVHFFPFLTVDSNLLQNGANTLLRNNVELLISFESDFKHYLWGKFCKLANIPQLCSERISPWIIENVMWNRQSRREFLHSCKAIHELLPDYLEFIPEEDRKKAFVVPNAASDTIPDHFLVRAEENTVLLYLGRFSDEKRPTLLLKAFALLAEEFSSWSLRFIGWGENTALLFKIREQLNLEERVEIRHSLDDINIEYNSTSIYCLPTLHEGFPNTVLEAMGNGLPIVGIKDCVAMKSIIQSGVTGILAEKPTPESLAEALRPLMASHEERIRMGKNAWEECRTKYSSVAIFDKWESELKRILHQNY